MGCRIASEGFPLASGVIGCRGPQRVGVEACRGSGNPMEANLVFGASGSGMRGPGGSRSVKVGIDPCGRAPTSPFPNDVGACRILVPGDANVGSGDGDMDVGSGNVERGHVNPASGIAWL